MFESFFISLFRFWKLLPMLFRRQVYSSWYLRHAVARTSAFSSPKWLASFFAMLSVERRVP
jgi:hypothetical protein